MSETNWQQIRIDYENGASLRQLAAKYHISKSVIGERKHKEQWDKGLPDTRTVSNKQEIISRDVNAGVRASMAVKLRAKKLTFEQIAQQCGYASAGACRNAILRELQRTITMDVDELRREELLILNIMHAEMWDMALDKSNEYRTFAVDRVLAISEARRKLMNLDMKPDEMPANMVVIREIPQGLLSPAIEEPHV